MLRSLAVAIVLLIAAAACGSGSSDPTPTPSPAQSPTPTPVRTATPTPTPFVAPDEYWFIGTVLELDSVGFDGPLLVTVEVDRTLGGVALSSGASVVVVVRLNFGRGHTPCASAPTLWGPRDQIEVGANVEIFGGPDERYDVDVDADVCGDSRYYVRVIPTPTPSPTPHDSTNDTRFMGVVREVFPCPANGRCWVEVEVLKSFDGVQLPAGETINLIGGGMAWQRCHGDWFDEISVEDEIEVFARQENRNWLSICDSPRYFVELLVTD